jgi:hypothetical protein
MGAKYGVDHLIVMQAMFDPRPNLMKNHCQIIWLGGVLSVWVAPGLPGVKIFDMSLLARPQSVSMING